MNELAANCLKCSRRRARGVIQTGKSGEFLFYRNQHSTSFNLPVFLGKRGDDPIHTVSLCTINSRLWLLLGGKHFSNVFFFFFYIYSHLCRNRRLWQLLKFLVFSLWFRNNYLPCQIHPEKLDTTHRSPGNRNEARLKKTRGKFMSAIYQLWIWGVVMVIWKFSSCVFPLSSFALARGAISLFREGFSVFFCFRVSLFWKARRGVSQCKISAHPEIIKQQPTAAARFRYFGKLKSRSLIE